MERVGQRWFGGQSGSIMALRRAQFGQPLSRDEVRDVASKAGSALVNSWSISQAASRSILLAPTRQGSGVFALLVR